MTISESLASRSARIKLRTALEANLPDAIDAIAAQFVPHLVVRHPDAYYVLTAGDLVKDAVEQDRILCVIEPLAGYRFGSAPISQTPTAYDRYRELAMATSVYHPHFGWEPLAYMSEDAVLREEEVYLMSDIYIGAMSKVIQEYARCSGDILDLSLSNELCSIEASLHRHGIIATAQAQWTVQQLVNIPHGVTP